MISAMCPDSKASTGDLGELELLLGKEPTPIQSVLISLRTRRNELAAQMEKIDRAVASLEDLPEQKFVETLLPESELTPHTGPPNGIPEGARAMLSDSGKFEYRVPCGFPGPRVLHSGEVEKV